MSTPSLDDDDLTIVRWYECERRPPVMPKTTDEIFDMYVCPWSGSHWHAGVPNRRRGAGRRIKAARFHLRKHLEFANMTAS